MRNIFWCAIVAALIAPSAAEAQGELQRAALAPKLLAIVQKQALPNSGTYSVIGTALVDSQTKVFIQQELEVAGRKSHVSYEYLCTLLDGEAGWMCAGQAPASVRLIHVK